MIARTARLVCSELDSKSISVSNFSQLFCCRVVNLFESIVLEQQKRGIHILNAIRSDPHQLHAPAIL
jgi:hypothetical protein